MANMNKGQGNGFILALHCLSGCFFLHYKSGAVWDDSTLPLCAWNFSMSPFVSNNLITRGSPGPCEASSFGRSQKQHLVSISELRLQQEPEVSASPGSKITSTVCKGQSHLRHLELYARFFFFFCWCVQRWRLFNHDIFQFLPIVSMFWIHCTLPRLCWRVVGSSHTSRKLDNSLSPPTPHNTVGKTLVIHPLWISFDCRELISQPMH